MQINSLWILSVPRYLGFVSLMQGVQLIFSSEVVKIEIFCVMGRYLFSIYKNLVELAAELDFPHIFVSFHFHFKLVSCS